jgi:hypothetical protein
MNRTTAKVAQILEVESPQVKRWAAEFKDYLSPAAKPAKGQVRMFSDSDLLVLMYISYNWEEEPDLESILTGLSRGEHREEIFLEQLYLHTPLIQEPPDDLDDTWRHGIFLVGGGRYEYLELARNYRQVAESTLRTAIHKDEIEGWAYPILFAYRHTLELYLKLIGEIDVVTHSLRACVELVEKRRGERFPSPIRSWILELDQVDPRGTAFRYPEEDCALNHHYEEWFDFQHFHFAMKQVFDILDRAILQVNAKGKRAKKAKRAHNKH